MTRKQERKLIDDSLTANINLLEEFWNRHTFHDMSIDSIKRINKRVVIHLHSYILVFSNVTRYQDDIEEFPTSWKYHSWRTKASPARLIVEAELGDLEIEFHNLRLLCNKDMVIHIPQLD